MHMSQWVDQELHNHPNRFSLNSLEKWDRLMCFLEERLEKGGKFIGNWKHNYVLIYQYFLIALLINIKKGSLVQKAPFITY